MFTSNEANAEASSSRVTLGLDLSLRRSGGSMNGAQLEATGNSGAWSTADSRPVSQLQGVEAWGVDSTVLQPELPEMTRFGSGRDSPEPSISDEDVDMGKEDDEDDENGNDDDDDCG